MLKIIGAVLVITACTGIGFYEGMELTKHEEVIKQLRQMVLLLKGEIRYGNSSLFDIFDKLSQKTDGTMQKFLKHTSQKMKQEGYQMFYDIFESCAVEENIIKRMTMEEKMSFLEFGKQLGGTDRETQLSQLELYLKELDTDFSELRREIQEKKKLYRNMGILGGCFLVLLLW